MKRSDCNNIHSCAGRLLESIHKVHRYFHVLGNTLDIFKLRYFSDLGSLYSEICLILLPASFYYCFLSNVCIFTNII